VSRIRRLVILFVTLVFFLYVGHLLVTQMLFADVYQLNYQGSHSGIPVPSSRLTNRFAVNGNEYTERVFDLPMSVDEAREWVKKRYPDSKTVSLPKKDESGISMKKVYGQMARPVEFSGMGWASISRFSVDQKRMGSRAAAEKLPFRGTHTLIKAKPGGHSQVHVVELDSGFDVGNWLTPQGKDTPGEDLEWLPRYPGSVREMSIVLEGDSGDSHTLAYGGPGSPSDHAAHYLAYFKKHGFKQVSDAPLENGVRMIEVKGENMEAAIFSKNKADKMGESSVLIQIRKYN